MIKYLQLLHMTSYLQVKFCNFFEHDITYWGFNLVDIIVITFHFSFIDSFSSSLQHECSDGDNVFLKRKHTESKHALRTPIMYCLYICLESSK